MKALENFSIEEDVTNLFVNNSEEVVILTDGLLVSFGCILLIENFVSIIILRRCTRLLFQIRSLSLNLAISDFVTGFILALPDSVLRTPFQCDFKKYLSFLCINVSLLIIPMMNLDRYFAFAYAMRYYSFITKKSPDYVLWHGC